MKEQPILMSAPEVRALLAGTKTQTRRTAKFPSWVDRIERVGDWYTGVGTHPVGECDHPKCAHIAGIAGGGGPSMFTLECPYGKPGDKLWVRETFSPWRRTSVEYPLEWEGLATAEERGGLTLSKWVEYYGHQDILKCYLADQKSKGEDVYIPSIHMPRWASRITLEITDVRVQRLQDISEEDARAEGASGGCTNCGESPCHPGCVGHAPDFKDGFANIWMGINGESSWDANPWVWALTNKLEAPCK